MSRHWAESVKEEARRLYADGVSLRELERRIGASYNTIRSWVLPEAHAKSLERAREYRKKWANKNPDYMKEYHKKWYEENKDCKLQKNSEWKEENPERFWAAGAVCTARQRSKRKDVPFDITADDVMEVFPEDGRCPIFGTEFVFQSGYGGRLYSPSLDRIVPELGYVVGNIAVISNRANMIKNNASPEELLVVAAWLERKRE